MTGVLIRGDTQKRRSWEDRHKPRNSRNHQKLKEAKKHSPLEPSEEVWSCEHVDFGLQAFGGGREWTVWVAPSCLTLGHPMDWMPVIFSLSLGSITITVLGIEHTAWQQRKRAFSPSQPALLNDLNLLEQNSRILAVKTILPEKDVHIIGKIL